MREDQEIKMNSINEAINKIKTDESLNVKRRRTVRKNICYGLLCLAISGFSTVLSAVSLFIPMLIIAGGATLVFIGFTTKYVRDLLKLGEDAKELDSIKQEYIAEKRNLMHEIEATREREDIVNYTQVNSQQYVNAKTVDFNKNNNTNLEK
ncbi:MAG: hypothetical protein J6Q51_04720 [Clostridia bacterium]|nr:hypothetical protein [Clostridia bacterium]